MQFEKCLKLLPLLLLWPVFFSCTPVLTESDHSSGPLQVSQNWILKNTGESDVYVVLESQDAAVISKFNVCNFNLNMKIKTSPGAEGAIAFHTGRGGTSLNKGYSVAINNSDYRSGSTQKTGSLSLIRNFFIRMIDDDEWFDLGVTVRGNNITVRLNGKTVSEYNEPENPLRIAGLENMVLSSGRIVFTKSSDQGGIFISDISIEALPDDLPFQQADFENVDEAAGQLTLLNQQGFPLMDLHGHEKGTLTIDQLTRHGRDHGYNFGISENCGLNFPVTDDVSLGEFYKRIADEPVFKAMQCEGREWVTLFSPELIERFDYIFTDAMTFTDHKGRRMRLWVRSEVVIEDEEQFMDMMVEKILAILSLEPIDIYVNPTYLPGLLNARYDELWTAERMNRVIDALVENDVALEINSRFRIPGIEFVNRARDAGVKFALGTNNAGANDLGRLEYSIQIIREAGITAGDMFIPRPKGNKKVSRMGLPEKPTG
jgi:hypothetical protein